MRVGVTSDTHGSLGAWQRALDLMGGVDLILHAGDVLYHGPRNRLPDGYDPIGLAAAIDSVAVPVIIAHGNCDAPIDAEVLNVPIQAPYAHVRIEAVDILVHHGTGLDRAGLVDVAARSRVRLLVSGHSHRPHLFEEHGIVFLNPGSPSLSKTEDGLGTAAIVDDTCIAVVRLCDASRVLEWRGRLGVPG